MNEKYQDGMFFGKKSYNHKKPYRLYLPKVNDYGFLFLTE